MNIKKGIHKIRHARPQWYKEYHEWEHHATLHWITFIVSCVVILVGFFNVAYQLVQKAPVTPAHAATATQNVTQSVTGGSLTITNAGNQSMSGATVQTNAQTTTGSLGTITVTDNRGTGAGWSTTATSTHFIKFNSPVTTGGANNTVSVNSGSTFSSGTGGTYTITITTGGAAGVAVFSVSGLESASNQTTGTNVAVGTFGLHVDFAAATYTTSDSWTIRVDVIPVTEFTLTPGSVYSTNSLTGVSGGSLHTFSSTSDPATIMTATAGDGMGQYLATPSASLVVPGNSFANTYTATVTETVQ